ncbi:phospholipase D-like domain-containing protein [Streptococcus lactarius]|nr:phospholipase D-like domain-containing protein [Streptococcus lactarius]
MTTYHLKSKSDNGGDSYCLDNIELLSNIDFIKIFEEISTSAKIDIVTYSFYDDEFVKKLFRKKTNVRVLLSKVSKQSQHYADLIREIVPNSDVIKVEESHAKIVLAEPNFVYLGSQNIDQSDWFQTGVVIRDQEIYKYYLKIVNDLAKGKLPYNYSHKSSDYVLQNLNKISYTPFTPLYSSKTLHNVEVKFSKQLNWNQKFNGLRNRKIIITTYTLPNMDYIRTMLTKLFKQQNDVTIYANSIALPTLEKLRNEFPSLDFETRPNLHSKMILVEDNIVWISSQNFGTSTWFENTLNIKSNDAYCYFEAILKDFLRRQ